MNAPRQQPASNSAPSARQRGSVLVVVLWIVFGLISITLYFANSMTYELRASDNRIASEEADFAIDAARRYITDVLSNLNTPGVMPDPQAYQCQAVEVGNAKFWFIGRTNTTGPSVSNVVFGLTSEGAKMNLNALPTAGGVGMTNIASNLALLPHMTQEVVWNLIAWGNTNTVNNVGAAESQTYQMQTPPYQCKNGPYETVDELRLVYNMTVDMLYGEDANLNGALDANENDGDILPPSDNQDGRLDPGLLELMTVYTVEPSVDTNGTNRINVGAANSATQISSLLETNLGTSRAAQILTSAGLMDANGNAVTTKTFAGPLDFYAQSQMTPQEYATIEGSLRGPNLKGLVNINWAPVQVLQCLPGMTVDTATQLVTARQSVLTDSTARNSIAWVAQAVQNYQTITNLAPWITGRTYQYMADVAAVGHDGRGYKRVRFVIDTSQGTPVIVYRQDVTHLGWALGRAVRSDLMAHK